MSAKNSRERALKQWQRRQAAAGLPELEDAGGIQAPARRRRAPALRLTVPSVRRVVASPPRALSLVALAALGLLAGHLATSPRYVVVGAVVMGNHRVPGDAIRSAAAVDGVRLFRLDAAAAETRVEAHPDIMSAQITARLPNQIWIVVTETAPVLRWETPGGVAVIDEDGHVISGAVATDGLATVESTLDPATLPEARLPRAAIEAALAYAPLFQRLSYGITDGFVGTTSTGWEVRLGSDPDRIERQAAVLAALERELQPVAPAVALVDLRYDRPYYRLHGGQGGTE